MDVILGGGKELVCFLLITKETEVIVNAVDGDVLEVEYERTVSLIDGFEIWD